MPTLSSIRSRLITWIALPTLVIYVGVLGFLFLRLRDANRTEVERNMMASANGYAAHVDAALREVASVARASASFAAIEPGLGEEQVYELLRANLQQNPLIYGSAMAFEPGAFREGNELFCPYVYRAEGDIRRMNIGRDVLGWYGDERWEWWHQPRRTGESLWTRPYFDDGAGDVLMITYAAPFTRDGAFRGVATVDVRVEDLRRSLGRLPAEEFQFVILSRDGHFVYARDPERVMNATVFEDARNAGREDIARVARQVISGETGAATLPGWDGQPPEGWEHWERPQLVFYAPIESTGWAFAALLPEHVAFADVRARMTHAAVGLAVTLALIVAAIWFVSDRITRPIARLKAAVGRIAGGDLDHRVDVGCRDELGELADSVNTMARDLKGHIEALARHRAGSREAMILALAKLAESRDDDTGKHLERICTYVELLVQEIARFRPDINGEWARTLPSTAALHDIGKVGIPDAVLRKPGTLTDEERRVMQAHTTIGGDTLIAVKQRWSEDAFLIMAAEIALAHHERWDGTGYPYGLAGEDIALSARIVAVADVYDALTSERCYKQAMPHEQAASIIRNGAGSHFDPNVVRAFEAVEARFRETAERLR